MPLDLPEIPNIPEIPEFSDATPVSEDTVRALWNLVRGLATLLQAEINTSRALAKLLVEDRENLENLFGIVRGHHTLLGQTIEILAELKGSDAPVLDLPRMPKNGPSPGNN